MARYRRKHLGGANPLLQVLLILFILVVVGIITYRQISRLKDLSSVEVVVTADTYPEGTVLLAEHLELKAVPKEGVPPESFLRIPDVEGRKLNRTLSRGEFVLGRDVRDVGVTKTMFMSDHIPKDRLLTTIAINEFTIPLSSLRAGDRVDILSSTGVRSAQAGSPNLIVRDAYVVAHIKNNSTPRQSQGNVGTREKLIRDLTTPSQQQPKRQQALVVAVKPEYVIPLSQLQESRTHLRLVVHSREAVESGELLAYANEEEPPAPPRMVEVITGTTIEHIEFK